MSLFLSYLLRLIPVWVTGTALSGGYETLQHLTGGVKTVLFPHLYTGAGIASLQLFSGCSRPPSVHFLQSARLSLPQITDLETKVDALKSPKSS